MRRNRYASPLPNKLTSVPISRIQIGRESAGTRPRRTPPSRATRAIRAEPSGALPFVRDARGRCPPDRPMRRLTAIVSSALAVAAATGLIFALRPVAPALSLGVLYLLAVLPVAVLWGLPYAIVVSVASMLALNWFFLPPRHTCALRDSENWVVLGVYLVTAVVVSGLAAGSRRRAAEAEQREREASLLADVAATLLESTHVQGQLREIAARVAAVLGTERASIELDSRRRPEPGEAGYDLAAGDRHVGRLFLGSAADERVAERLLPALASVLAVGEERERLGRKALEAEALRRSDAVKTALLRTVSHDLRSPLTAILVSVEGLESASLELNDED